MHHTGYSAVAAALLLVTAGGALTGCNRPPAPEAAPSSPAAPEPAQWRPCDPEPPKLDDADAQKVLATAECATVSVPLDYDDPDGALAEIAMLRLPATGDRIGSLFVNPGGPGASGVEYVASYPTDFPARIRERFDVIGFDPRGIGQSTPTIDCNSDAEEDAERADPDVDYSPAGVASIDAESEEFVERCVARTDEGLLANASTDSVVRDLDRLRIAVGDDGLTYYGASYGTRIGSEYAEMFGDRVRAMVNDGAVDPAVPAMQWPIDQAASFQKVFDEYAKHCATQPDCPLGTDPSKAAERLGALIDPLVDAPARTTDPRGLSYDDARWAIDWGLYPPEYWGDLTTGLKELRDGEPADILLGYADESNERDAEGKYSNYNDAFAVLSCADYRYEADPAAWAEYDRKLREANSYWSYGRHTGHAPRSLCTFFPEQSDYQARPASAPDLPETLVISTTLDPATPYLDGVHLAEQLKARLLTVDGIQHTAAFYGNACVDDIVSAYLVDLELPQADTRCGSPFVP